MMEQSKYLKAGSAKSVNWIKLAVYFMFFLTVFFNMINRAASPVLYAYIAVSGIYIISHRQFDVGRHIAFMVAFLLYAMIACFWTNATNPFEDVVRVVLKYTVFAFCFYNTIEEKEDCEKCLKLFCIAGLCFSIYSIAFYGISGILEAIQAEERLGQEICGINPFGMYAGLTCALCLLFAKNKGKVHYYALMLLPLLLVAASSSRKAILLVLAAFLYFFALQNMRRSFWKGFFSLVITVFVLVFVLQLPAFEQFWMRLEIFFETFLGDAGTDASAEERMRLVEIGVDLFRESPLIGKGTNAFRALASQYITSVSEISAHNSYIDILANFGIIGFVLYYVPAAISAVYIFKGVLRDIPVFYGMFFLVLISFVLLDMSYVSYHFIVPYVFYSLFDRTVELYRDDLKTEIVRPESEYTVKEVSKYLK